MCRSPLLEMNSVSLNSEIPVFCEVLVYLNVKHVPYSREKVSN